jgi:hypothetical protein
MEETKQSNIEPSPAADCDSKDRATTGQVISITIFLVVWAIARKNLTVTCWTLLAITADNVKLSLDDATVVTSLLVCAPIILFLSVPNALNVSASYAVAGL